MERFKQILLALTASLGPFCGGIVVGYTACALPSMESSGGWHALHITETQSSFISSLMPLGSMIGNMIVSPLMDGIGRRGVMLYICVPGFIVGWILIAVAVHVAMCYIGRLIGGAASGIAFAAAPLYTIEIVDIKLRGALGSLTSIMMTVGMLFSYAFGSFLNWRWLAIAGLIAVFPYFLLLLFYVPETPPWLLAKGRREEAERILLSVKGNREQLEASRIQGTKSYRAVTQLKETATLKAFMTALGVTILQEMCGISAVTFNTLSIFQQTISTIDSNLAVIIIGVVQLLSACTAASIVERVGRKPLFTLSAGAMTLSLTALGAYFFLQNEGEVSSITWLPLLSLIIFTASFYLGFGPLTYIVCPELLPSAFRAMGTHLCIACNAFCAFIVTVTFNDLQDALQLYGVFWLYAVISILAVIFCVWILPETKGKTDDAIQAHFT